MSVLDFDSGILDAKVTKDRECIFRLTLVVDPLLQTR